MARIDCPFESDVLMMVTTGRWPDRAPDELRAHANDCALCRDLAVAAQAIDEARTDGASIPALPGAGTVWWRAQLRARQDAVREVARPISIAHAVGLTACVGVAGAVFGATAGWFQHALARVWTFLAETARGWELPRLSVGLDLSAAAPYVMAFGILAAGMAVMTLVVAWVFREDS